MSANHDQAPTGEPPAPGRRRQRTLKETVEREAQGLRAVNTACRKVRDAVDQARKTTLGELARAHLHASTVELAETRDLLERTSEELNEAWRRRGERLERLEMTARGLTQE